MNSDATAPITVEVTLPPGARPGSWVRIHEADLPEPLHSLPIGGVVVVRDAQGAGHRLAVVDQVDRDSLGRRYWLLLIAPRIAMTQAARTLDVLVDYVVATNESVTITRRGKPIAHMIKVPAAAAGHFESGGGR